MCCGDSADNPTFIETLPRRGYRFIAPVQKPAIQAIQEANAQQATLEQNPISSANIPLTPALPKNHTVRNIAVAAGAVLILTGGLLWRSQPLPPTVANTVRITNDGKTKNSLNPFVSDGVHLYFMEGPPTVTESGIAQVSAAGGETTWLPTTLKNVLAVSPVSPDRSGCWSQSYRRFSGLILNSGCSRCRREPLTASEISPRFWAIGRRTDLTSSIPMVARS